MPRSQSKNASQILWWVGWILLTVGSFFVSCAYWTWFIGSRFGTVRERSTAILWVVTVFGTWMVFLIPLIVWMYWKVDKAYEDARIRREEVTRKKAETGVKVRSQSIEPSRRMLSSPLRKKLRKIPEAIRRGHLVTAALRDGRRIEHVFVADSREVLGVYGMKELSFDPADIVDLVPADLEALPSFRAEEWLRLDGVEGYL